MARARGPRGASATGEELGTIVELYRAGGAEVFVVRGPRGEIDVPGVHGIVIELAPERGEMVVDLEALDLDARPVEASDYVRAARPAGRRNPSRRPARRRRRTRPTPGPRAGPAA